MLILQRVCQLVSHYWLLSFKLYPIGQIKLLSLWIVIARNLLGKEFDDEGPVLKFSRSQSEFLQREFRRMHFGRGRLFIKIFYHHSLNFYSRLRATFDRPAPGPEVDHYR